MRRHLDNLEGAFPLLLIGSVLVVYAGILASQQMGSHSSHLPLWGLLGGVGAVIVGSGIYSTFLEPGGVPTSKPSDEWVTVRRTEWDAQTRSRAKPERVPAPAETAPIWWEGPAPYSTTASSSRTTTPPATARTAPAPAPKAAPFTERRPPRPTRSVPHPSARYSYKELTDELTELESLVYGSSGATRLRSAAPPPVSGGRATPTCMDCDRPLTSAASATPCQGCGRGLCGRCTASSRSEDGEVRCVDCRARGS